MESQSIGRAIPINELKVPSVLYKYRDYNNLNHLKSINNCEVYLPSANDFNDPLDSKIPFRYNEDDLTPENIYKKCLEIAKRNYLGLTEQQYQIIAYDGQKKGLLFDEEYLDVFDKDQYLKICRSFGIYCLTADSDNFLMWSYYANSHKGFCIGYDSKILLNSGLFSMGGEVMYRDDFPKLPLFLTETDSVFLNIFYTKWTAWKHEKEYRLLHTYKTGKIQTVPKNAINEIILGCQFPENEKRQLTMMLEKDFPHIVLSQMRLIKNGFGLKKEILIDPKLLLKQFLLH